MIIALMGFMGCGKSSVGREAARRLGWRFVDLDDAVSARAGAGVQEIFVSEGEAAFRRYELSALKDLLTGDACELVLSLGGGTPTIPEAFSLIKSKTYVIYLSATPQTLSSHLENEIGERPLLRDGGFEKLSSLLERREGIYDKLSNSTVFVDNLNLEEVVDKVLNIVCQLKNP